jgi:hypothetical protein
MNRLNRMNRINAWDTIIIMSKILPPIGIEHVTKVANHSSTSKVQVRVTAPTCVFPVLRFASLRLLFGMYNMM